MPKYTHNKLLHRTPQAVTIFAEQKYAPTYYAGEQGVRRENTDHKKTKGYQKVVYQALLLVAPIGNVI